MRIIHKIIAVFAVSAIFTRCVRETEVLEPVALPSGGLGGKGTIKVTPQHHKVNINTGVVYIKFATKIMPAALDSFDATDTIDAIVNAINDLFI